MPLIGLRKDHQLIFFSFSIESVFLGPQPSTYINATFIEGYDNSESFIITQDPLEETIGDFWRMISEQSINTIVMISEVSEFMIGMYAIDLKLIILFNARSAMDHASVPVTGLMMRSNTSTF